jgi:hypothetical protein
MRATVFSLLSSPHAWPDIQPMEELCPGNPQFFTTLQQLSCTHVPRLQR